MKLRLQANSIRLRLKRGEVEQLRKQGRVEETITLGQNEGESFTYTLESSADVSSLQAQWTAAGLRVVVPVKLVMHWSLSDDVAMETRMAVAPNAELHLLIEKDFACLNGTDEQNRDTFPNPLAGTKC